MKVLDICDHNVREKTLLVNWVYGAKTHRVNVVQGLDSLRVDLRGAVHGEGRERQDEDANEHEQALGAAALHL